MTAVAPLAVLLRQVPVLPVVAIADERQAIGLGQALLDGGIGAIEVTLRTPAALAALARLRAELPELLLGIGTVLTVAQVEQVAAFNPAFLVSPGLSAELAATSAQIGVPYLPGVATASDIMRGLDLGLSIFKLFPANIVGGPAAAAAFAGPFPDVRFCATGGVDESNAAAYFAQPNVLAVGASAIAPRGLVAAGDWAAIAARARQSRSWWAKRPA